jgi:pyoverdine/dityrosine biosynthesis protein Dit1
MICCSCRKGKGNSKAGVLKTSFDLNDENQQLSRLNEVCQDKIKVYDTGGKLINQLHSV